MKRTQMTGTWEEGGAKVTATRGRPVGGAAINRDTTIILIVAWDLGVGVEGARDKGRNWSRANGAGELGEEGWGRGPSEKDRNWRSHLCLLEKRLKWLFSTVLGFGFDQFVNGDWILYVLGVDEVLKAQGFI